LELSEILESIQSKKITIPKAEKLLSLYSIEKIEDFAKIDIDRQKRRGIPEIIFAESKMLDEIKKITKQIMKKSNLVIISRIKKDDYSKIISFAKKSRWNITKGKNSTTILLYKKPIKPKSKGAVGIITAGTSDIGVAEEARLVCEAMNCKCYTIYDMGVAGMHRVFSGIKELVENDVDVIIVVAGMEGALATIVSSLVDIPVIGVPTSVGYGYGKKGIAALASMLQSCALGMSVVNIDNGIGAGATAASISRRINYTRSSSIK
jgi:NCAIR mutase (PurE)-related protein